MSARAGGRPVPRPAYRRPRHFEPVINCDVDRPGRVTRIYTTGDRVALAGGKALADGGEACRDMHRPDEVRARLRGDVSAPRLWRDAYDCREALRLGNYTCRLNEHIAASERAARAVELEPASAMRWMEGRAL